jgi:hypothetical protein
LEIACGPNPLSISNILLKDFFHTHQQEVLMVVKNHVIGAQKPQPKDRSFICDDELRNVKHEGRPGFFVRVRLPSYRSLPLSCIEKIELSIDGAPVAPKDITFVLNGYSHKLEELGGLSKIFWFILDYADLFVETQTSLSAGEHQVEGTMVIVEPYMTVGRFPFFYSAQKRLPLATDFQEMQE